MYTMEVDWTELIQVIISSKHSLLATLTQKLLVPSLWSHFCTTHWVSDHMAFVFKSPSPPQRIAILCKIFVPYHLLNLHHYIHHHPSITNWFPMFVLLNQRGFKITSNRHSSGHIGTWNLLRRAEKIYTNTSMAQNWVPPIRFFSKNNISAPDFDPCPAVPSCGLPSHPIPASQVSWLGSCRYLLVDPCFAVTHLHASRLTSHEIYVI